MDRIFRRRRGRDARAWPLLALLFLVVLVAIGCVLWFMREAMRNERLAVREKLMEAYRGHLSLVQVQAVERWGRWRAELDEDGPAAAQFVRCVREGRADSALLFDEQGRVVYPQPPQAGESGAALAAQEWQATLRALVQAGKKDEAVQFIVEKFAATDAPIDEHGRNLSANAELLALELLSDQRDPRFTEIAGRLRDRITDYSAAAMPATQRRFLMNEMRRLDPTAEFPMRTAEDLAAQFLETNPSPSRGPVLRATELPDVWSVASPSGRVLALLTTTSLRTKLAAGLRDLALPPGVSLAVLAPGEEPSGEPAPVVSAFGTEMPGWRLALAFDDRTLFDAETAKRVKFYLAVACVVISAMTVLAIFLARGFGRQMELARLKNDLVATVSHELKTPLTAMRALVDTLLDTEPFDEKTTREYLRLLATENARLSRLIDNFLTFSRLERNKFTFEFSRVSPSQIVENAIAAFGDRAQMSGCQLETRVAADLPAVLGDPDALGTALLNLLDNSWKYSGAEKRIVIRAEARAGAVSFAVEDNGIGLSPAESSRIFHRFYQVDQRLARVAGGCGLGLSIVRTIAEAHRGKVEVVSAPGRGSTFTIEIPALPKSAS